MDGTMNEIEFEKVTGRKPEQDDLERANCDQAGKIGHWGCGVCIHKLPVFECWKCFGKFSYYEEQIRK